VFTESLACAETNCANQLCAVKFRAWLKPVGKFEEPNVMSMQDPVSDMLTCIRNAHHRSHPEVSMPASKLKASVAKVLQDEGYIEASV